MLVRFRSKESAEFVMLGDIAVKLIQLMGHSGTIPGAIAADDVPAALERLREALAIQGAAPAPEPEDEEEAGEREPPVTLANRAYPLIEMLKAAAANDSYVMWDR
ncbi:MAG: DUF1840 domain-containing protein [Gammaproteobacteria bacterium]|nr:DUF1840 domain-containing protein [Gammaproteobacteria bacterium]